MRRAFSAIALTTVGLGALAMFHSTSTAGHALAHAAPAPLTTTRPIARTPATAAPSRPAATAPPATAPPRSTTPATSAPAGKSGTFDGDPVDNQYGTVQVRITMQNGRISAVDALQMPYDHQRSAYISQQAGPYLQQESLQAQSAQIDTVSGATYTSDSYAQSLQSAIDRAHA